MYVNSHFVITTTFLAWLYLFRNEHFYFVRNMFMVAMGIALIGYAAVPDGAAAAAARERHSPTRSPPSPGVEQDTNAVSLLVNKYAAVPSMHIGFASMIAGSAVAARPQPVGRRALGALPAARLRGDRRHGNHFWFDARRRRRGRRGRRALIAHRLLAPVRPALGVPAGARG